MSTETAPVPHVESNRICLIVPYFEAGEDLVKSLNSVNLTRSDKIIVVDDGSQILPAKEFCPVSVHDTPVELVSLKENLGITRALLAGLSAASSEYTYIGRLDCGDTCDKDRFTRQRNYLRTHPEAGIVGSWVQFVSSDGSPLYVLRLPTEFDQIKRYMRINAAFIHPAVLMRRDIYDAAGGYSESFPAAEDFALFRAMLQHSSGANLPLVLTSCLTSVGGISDRNRRQQLLSRIRVLRKHFDWHPLSIYGIVRAAAQLGTSRRLTTFIKRLLH